MNCSVCARCLLYSLRVNVWLRATSFSVSCLNNKKKKKKKKEEEEEEENNTCNNK